MPAPSVDTGRGWGVAEFPRRGLPSYRVGKPQEREPWMASLRAAKRSWAGGGLAVLSLALLLTPRGASAQASFTLEDVLSAPFPSALIGDPTGTRVAWVQNDRGARNIWLAEAPDFRGRPHHLVRRG